MREWSSSTMASHLGWSDLRLRRSFDRIWERSVASGGVAGRLHPAVHSHRPQLPRPRSTLCHGIPARTQKIPQLWILNTKYPSNKSSQCCLNRPWDQDALQVPMRPWRLTTLVEKWSIVTPLIYYWYRLVTVADTNIGGLTSWYQ
jgi:hypothetical protein